MKRICSVIIIFCSVLLLCGFSEADYALYVYFEDGDLYMRNDHASIITNDPGVYFHVDVRTTDYDYICSTENIKLEVGETALIMTAEELLSIAGDLPGILVHGNSNVFIWGDDFTNDLYYYFEETPADDETPSDEAPVVDEAPEEEDGANIGLIIAIIVIVVVVIVVVLVVLKKKKK